MQLPTSYAQPPATVDSPSFFPAPVTGSVSRCSGLSVAVLPTITAFFASLSPRYETQRQWSTVAPPTMANSADPGSRSFKASDVASKVKLGCNVLASWVPAIGVVNEAVTVVCSTLSLAQELDGVLEGKKKKTAPQMPNITGPAAAALTLAAMDSLPTAAAVPASGMRGSAQNPIPVSDSATLGKIGQEGYPSDGYYIQERSFRHDISESGPDFDGHYDGGCHTISGLKSCLFREIQRHGDVRNLRLVDVAIDYNRPMQGVLACTMAPYSTARDIQVAHASVKSQRGGEVGKLAAAGVIVGHQKVDALIRGVDLRNCSVLTYSGYAATGVLGGMIDGRVQDANINACQAESRGRESPTGIGAGRLQGDIERLAVGSSQVRITQYRSHAGIGAGQLHRGSIRQFGAGRCQVFADGEEAMAGIGAGLAVGDLKQLTVAECQVITSQDRSFAGIGAGQLGPGSAAEQNHLDDLVAVDSSVENMGKDAIAGIGIGKLDAFGRADRMTLFNCSVAGQSDRVYTGAGAGYNDGQINNLTSVESEARNTGGTAGLESGNVSGRAQGTASLNNRINDELQTSKPPALPGLCHGADPRFVTPDCSPVPYTDPRPACSSTPLVPECGSVWLPIEVNDEEIVNSIGRYASFPPDAFYTQTRDLDGSRLDSNSSLVFSGHYDGQNHVIRNQHACLFRHLRGTLKNLHLTDARISVDDQHTAVAACTMSGGSLIKNLLITDSQVINHRPAGIISGQRIGRHNQIRDIEVHNATLETHGDGASAGVIAATCQGVARRVDIHNSQVKTRGNRADAGLGCGMLTGKLITFSATCSQVETLGNGSRAGIVAGLASESELSQMTIVNSNITTSGMDSFAGGGAGLLDGELVYFNALHTRVHTRGDRSSAGTGIGHFANADLVLDFSSVDCETVTEGSQAHAGVCTGTLGTDSYLLRNTRSVNNTVQVNGRHSRATVYGLLPGGSEAFADKAITVNTRVNHSLVDDGPVSSNISKYFCESADPSLVTADCRINPLNLPEHCAMPSAFPAPNRSALPTTCLLVPPTPTDVSALPLTVSAAAPLASGLSLSTIGTIVGATTVGVIAAGIVAACCYRHYHRSPQPEDGIDMSVP